MRAVVVWMVGVLVLLAQPLPPQLAGTIDKKGIVLVDFFASWCHSCRKELPILLDFVKRHPDISLVAVDVDENKEAGEAFVEELGLKSVVLYDTKQEIIKAFDPAGIPALYIFKDGKLVGSIIGARKNIQAHILKAIQ